MSNKLPFLPDIIEEGKKYGLSERQLSRMRKYLNDRRLLRLINLEMLNRNARAWLSALTGIVADILAIDAHATMWLNRKLDKPRNWVVSKLTSIIPTKIDDAAFKAIQMAQEFADNKLLPAKEEILSSLSSIMHKKYDYNTNYTILGQTLKEQKANIKANLNESKASAKDAIKELQHRKMQVYLYGKYRDNDGDWHRVRSTWEENRDKNLAFSILNKGKENRYDKQNKQKQEVPEEGETTKEQGVYP